MVKESDLPDLSDLERTKGRYIVACLAGFVQRKGNEFDRALGAACRLIDKARSEYQEVKHLIAKEEKERSLTYEQILQRNEGQYMYMPGTIDHLENCLNSIARIYKLLPLLGSTYTSSQSKSIVDCRNTIEHIDERINRAVSGPLAPLISEGELIIELAGDSIRVTDLSDEIRRLNVEILSILGKL